MADRKNTGTNESFSENSRVGESFNFTNDGSNSVWNENFVFKAEDNTVTSTNDVGNTGLEENDAGASNFNSQKTAVDNNDSSSKRNNRNNNSNNNNTVEEEAASEGAASSSTISSSSTATTSGVTAGSTAATSVASTIASVATTAVVIVVGGSIVVNGTAAVEPPAIVEFEQIEAGENTINFTLLLGDDYETINSEAEQKDCTMAVELTCERYKDFRQTFEVNNYGRISGSFADLYAKTEYTLDVYQRNLLDIETHYLIEPVKISTTDSSAAVVIAPTSFVISPSSARAVVGGEPLQLSVTNVQPENADASVTWSSSNPSIASVDSTGAVTGLTISDEPVTITATSTLNPSVTATATIYTSTNYVPTFDKVVDPFDDAGIYMIVDVANETRTFDVYDVELIKLDRDTGEPDPNVGRPYITLSSITNRQLLDSSEEEIDPEGLYQVVLTGWVFDEQDDPDASAPTGDGTEYVLYDGIHDFSLISSTYIGDGTGFTNQLYLKKRTITNSEDDPIDNFSYYEAFVDVPDIESGQNGAPLYVGMFSSDETNPILGGNENNSLTSFTVNLPGEKQRVDFNTANVPDYMPYASYKFVVYKLVDGSTYEAITEPQMISMWNIDQKASKDPFLFENSVQISIGKGGLLTDQNLRVSVDLNSNYLYKLERTDWTVTLYEDNGSTYSVVQENLQFEPLPGFTGLYGRYVLDITNDDETLWYTFLPESKEDCSNYVFSIKDASYNTYWNIPYTSTVMSEDVYADGSVLIGFTTEGNQTVETRATATPEISDLLFGKYERVVISGSIDEDIDTSHEFVIEVTSDNIRTPINICEEGTTEQLVLSTRMPLEQLNISYQVLGYIEGAEEPVVIYSEWLQNWS